MDSACRIGSVRARGPSVAQAGSRVSRLPGRAATPRMVAPGRKARGRGPAISQADLDKDLDSYMADS